MVTELPIKTTETMTTKHANILDKKNLSLTIFKSKNHIHEILPMHNLGVAGGHFRITTKKGHRYFMKTVDNPILANNMISMSKLLLAGGVSTPKVLYAAQYENLYCILTQYYTPTDLSSLESDKLYHVGQLSGQNLFKLHNIPIQTQTLILQDESSDSYVEQVLSLPLVPNFKDKSKIIDFINKHRHLIHNSPVGLIHWDYHIHNIIYCNEKLYMVDLDNIRLGRAYRDFYHLAENAKLEFDNITPYNLGLLDGYFTKGIPDDFWTILALYLFLRSFERINWYVSIGDDFTVQRILEMIKKFLHINFDGLTKTVPSWYTNAKS